MTPRPSRHRRKPKPRVRHAKGGPSESLAMPRSVKAWLSHHLYVFFSSLGQLNRTLLPSLMTAAVIGIALALPAGLYLLLENALQVSRAWDSSVQISLFLKHEVADSRAYELKRLLEQRKDIVGIQVITREQALEEYRKLSGFGDALDALDENPLPMVLTIQPILNHPHSSQELLEDLNELPEVDIAQFDVYWLKRLFAIMEIVRRGVLVLAALLALAVLLIVGNTIRLAIENRRTEIEVNKLFGATDAFIRRPFLYSGLWYGFFGGLIAWMLVKLAFWSLQEPAKRLIALYHSHYELVTLGWNSSLVLLLLGIFLGLGGAWLAVGRHLQDIQPR